MHDGARVVNLGVFGAVNNIRCDRELWRNPVSELPPAWLSFATGISRKPEPRPARAPMAE